MTKPYACVQKDSSTSYCGRFVGDGSSEFSFRDPGHAAYHYAGSKWLDVCSKCVEAIGEVPKPVTPR